MGRVAWKTVVVDSIVCPVGCELLYVALNGADAAAADCAVYDGDSAAGRLITLMRSFTGELRRFDPPEPVRCDSGIFVAAGEGVGSVFVQFRCLEEGG